MHVDGVARVSSKLAESSLAAAHALSQAATGACSPQGEGSMISMAYHQRVRTRDVSWGGRDVSWKKDRTYITHIRESCEQKRSICAHPLMAIANRMHTTKSILK